MPRCRRTHNVRLTLSGYESHDAFALVAAGGVENEISS